MASEHDPDEGLRARITKQGEDTLGKLAQDLLENPLINNAITRALGAREKAAAAQEVAMGALNIPSAADLERLTRRLRSVAQRLEGIEDAIDRLEERVAASGAGAGGGGIEQRLEAIEAQLAKLAEGLLPQGASVPRGQERLTVPTDG